MKYEVFPLPKIGEYVVMDMEFRKANGRVSPYAVLHTFSRAMAEAWAERANEEHEAAKLERYQPIYDQG